MEITYCLYVHLQNMFQVTDDSATFIMISFWGTWKLQQPNIDCHCQNNSEIAVYGGGGGGATRVDARLCGPILL